MKTNITLWELLNNKRVEIPIIQRDYAQGRKGNEYIRKTFLQSIKDSLDGGQPLTLDFVYGNEENDGFLPLDGQQRLTTLWLIHWFIAFKSGKLEEDKERGILKKFTYKTRDSSRDFCVALCDNVRKDEVNTTNLVEYIQGQTWFYSSWRQDPTVNAMLRTIGPGEDANNDNIVAIFSKATYENYCKYWELLTNNRMVQFELLKIGAEKLPISDDLYIKMNARGKKLSDFENFKAHLISWLNREENKDNEGIIVEYAKKIDNDWLDVFWKKRNSNNKIDEIYFSFMNRYILNQICLEKDENGEYFTTKTFSGEKESENVNWLKKAHFDKLNGTGLAKKGKEANDGLIRYEGFEPYKGYFSFENMEKLDNIFSYLKESKVLEVIDNSLSIGQGYEDEAADDLGTVDYHFIPVYDTDKAGNEKSTARKTSQKERIYFHAICLFFETENFKNTNWDDTRINAFKDWMRVARNLIENARVDSIDSMIICLRLIDELGKYLQGKNWDITTIKEFAPECIKEASSALGLQLEEEKEKCAWMKINPEYEEEIKKAEKLAFFGGAIRFLYKDAEGQEDWGNFAVKLKNAMSFFNGNEVSLDTIKSFLSTFQRFEDLEQLPSYFFTTIGYHPRNNCWKRNILCEKELKKYVHDFLLKNSASSKDNNYKDFIESGTVEYICQKSDNYKYHYRKYKSTAALHRENGQSYIYVDNDSLALFETLINGTNNGINMDKQIMKGRYLMGGNIPFPYKNNKFIFDVAKRQIFIVNDEQQPIGAGVELKSTDDLVALLDGLLQADTLTDGALN